MQVFLYIKPRRCLQLPFPLSSLPFTRGFPPLRSVVRIQDIRSPEAPSFALRIMEVDTNDLVRIISGTLSRVHIVEVRFSAFLLFQEF